jgi:hypothetical protein
MKQIDHIELILVLVNKKPWFHKVKKKNIQKLPQYFF